MIISPLGSSSPNLERQIFPEILTMTFCSHYEHMVTHKKTRKKVNAFENEGEAIVPPAC